MDYSTVVAEGMLLTEPCGHGQEVNNPPFDSLSLLNNQHEDIGASELQFELDHSALRMLKLHRLG